MKNTEMIISRRLYDKLVADAKESMDKTTRDSIACDVAYAIRQLKGITDGVYVFGGRSECMDAAQRALDALERIETALGDNGPADDDPRETLEPKRSEPMPAKVTEHFLARVYPIIDDTP